MGWVSGGEIVCSVGTTRGRKDWTMPVGGSRKGKEIVMLGPVWRVGRTDGTKWAGPVKMGSLIKKVTWK